MANAVLENKNELFELAENGDAEAQFDLALAYYNGDGIEEDKTKAVYWFSKAAEQGHPGAQFNLGLMYDNGEGVEADKGKAVHWYKKAADQGNESAQFNLALMYYDGDGIEADRARAAYWFSKAAEQGHTYAQFNIGLMYDNGDGIEADKEEAACWYEKAAEQGHAGAQNNLGLMYDNGEGIEADKGKAIYWYEKAAEQGNESAQFNLGLMYDNGDGIEADKGKAVHWYEKAAEQGNPKAQFNLGLMYYNGDGIEADKEEAACWYEKAAEQGHAGAQNNLGLMYYDGDGIEENKTKAAHWYKKAADQGNESAQFNLALMYYDGDGIEADRARAAYWFSKAAEQGHTYAQFNIGLMYDNGDGIEADKEEAACWYEKAAEQGHAGAQNNLGLMYDNGEGIEADKGKAIYWYEKAAEQGNANAQFNLALEYNAGDGVKTDKSKAIELFKESADNGYSESLYQMALIFLELNEGIKAKEHFERYVKQQPKDTDSLSDAYFNLSQFYLEYDKEKGKTKNFKKAKEYLDLAADLGSEGAKELVKAVNDELYVGDSQNNKMGLLAKELIEKQTPISNLSEEAEKAIRDRFGEMYDYLKPSTKASLVTSLLTYISFMSVGEDKYRNLDFSSVINPITKSLEIELKHIFYTRFMDYLIQNNIPPTEFDPTKQFFVAEIKPKVPPYEQADETEINSETANTEEYNYFKQKKYDRSSAVKYVIGEHNGAFSLGGMRKSIAIQEKPVVVSNVSYGTRNWKRNDYVRKEITMDKHFFDYISNVFKDDAFSGRNREWEMKKYLLRLVNKVGSIAFDLRNPSNHTQIMECWKATHCGNIVFMKDNFLMDFLSKIKPEYLSSAPIKK